MRPNPKYWTLYEHGSHSDCPTNPNLASSIPKTKKCFQTDFKSEFSGVLDRTFSGIHNVKQFEVNFIRPVDGFSGKEEYCVQHDSSNMFNCWIIEFSLKIDTTTKLVNAKSFDQAMTEGNDFQSKTRATLQRQCKGWSKNGKV